MYGPVKRLALAILRTPQDAPQPPLGSHASVEVFRASPKFLTYRLLGFWLRTAFVTVVELVVLVGGVVAGEPVVSVLALLAAVAIVAHQFLDYFAIRLDWDLRHYIVTDRSLRVREGAWIVREMTITHANVQNLRVVQGPVQRLFGIASLEVDTAGGGGAAAARGGHGMGTGHMVRLAGIENAAAVRDRILEHLRARGGGAGLGDHDDEGERAPAGGTAASPEGRAAGGASDLVGVLRELRDAARGLRSTAEAAR